MLRPTIDSNGSGRNRHRSRQRTTPDFQSLFPHRDGRFTGASSISSNTVALPETTPSKTYSQAPCMLSVTRSRAKATARNEDEAIRPAES